MGNVPANAKVQIQIRAVGELQQEIDAEASRRLNIPLTIMPKYTPESSQSHLSNVLDSVPRVSTKPYDFKLTGQVYVDGLISLESKKKEGIKISKMNQDLLNFEINPENLTADIILTITRSKPKSFIVCESSRDLSVDADPLYTYASQLSIIPDYSLPLVPVPPVKDLCYVIIIDRSGSMEGKAFENAIESAKIFVSNLPSFPNLTFMNLEAISPNLVKKYQCVIFIQNQMRLNGLIH